MLPLLICLCTLCNSTSDCLTWGRKKRKKKRERGTKNKKIKNKPPADFKPVQRVLLVFLNATGREGLGFAFIPSYVFERMGTRSGPQYSQLLSLRPRFSGALFHSATQSLASNQLLGAQHEASGVHSSTEPPSLWAFAAGITLGLSQPLLESSLQSSCPPFLTSAWLFTQPNFLTSL